MLKCVKMSSFIHTKSNKKKRTINRMGIGLHISYIYIYIYINIYMCVCVCARARAYACVRACVYGNTNQSDKTKRVISFMLFIFPLFSTSFNFGSSSGEKIFCGKNFWKLLKIKKIFLKKLICYMERDVKYTVCVEYPLVKWMIGQKYAMPPVHLIYIYNTHTHTHAHIYILTSWRRL